MILFGPSGNDGHEVTISDEQYSFIQIEKIQLLLHTRIARLLQSIIDKHVFARKSAKNYPLVPRVSLTEYAKILSDIIREARANHIHLVFLTRPYLDDHTTQFNAKSYNKLTQEVALQQSIPLIDIEGHFATTSALFNDPTHLNPEGLHQMAQYIIMNLQQMSLLPH